LIPFQPLKDLNIEEIKYNRIGKSLFHQILFI